MTIPINHLIFIPITLLAGFIVGWKLGTRNIREEWARAERKRRDRDEGEPNTS